MGWKSTRVNEIESLSRIFLVQLFPLVSCNAVIIVVKWINLEVDSFFASKICNATHQIELSAFRYATCSLKSLFSLFSSAIDAVLHNLSPDLMRL